MYTLKTIKCCWEKFRKTQINGTVCHKHGLNGLILLSDLSQINLYIQLNPYQNCSRLPISYRNGSIQFSHSVVSNSLWPHELQYARLPCPSPTPGACSNSCPLSRWCHPTISSSVVSSSSHLQSSPASESFQMNQFFTSGGQSIGVSASASVLPMNIQDWSPLGWTGWISLLIEMDKLILKFIWT